MTILHPEPEIQVRTREDVLYLLAEAAEIEHNLMCCYLYAAFSLKRPEEGGLSSGEAAAVARWRSTIMRVAIEEMSHLALASNLIAALGGRPHFGRPNMSAMTAGRPSPRPASISLMCARNGPLAVRAPIHLKGSPIGMRATLCRCGASKNKPFCDGSHVKAGFQAV